MKLEITSVRELDYVREVGKNPLLAYTMLHTIDKFQRTPCVPPQILSKFKGLAPKHEEAHYVLTPSRFYRILFQIHKDCEKRKLELRLPYYWYKTGPVVYGRGAPRIFDVTRVKKTQQVTASFDQWKDTILIFDGYESSFSDAILLTLNVDILARYTKLDLIYEYSPSQMHKVLVTALSQLQNAAKKEVADEGELDSLSRLLARVVGEDFDDRYSELYVPFERAIDMIQTELAPRPDLGYVRRIAEEVWNVFALGLRAKENANVDQNEVKKWKNKYMHALTAFSLQLSSV
ncbi:MAG TPA: hypothetical protein VEF35_00730 [Candidatus Bathyarchaeia archaeon]|nr:hypothetical protein [Candidatus Bathyarchaeia archaeon]